MFANKPKKYIFVDTRTRFTSADNRHNGLCDLLWLWCSITTVTYKAGIDFIFILIKNLLFNTNLLTEKIDLEINEICKPFKIQALYKSPAFF
jgi:hypothetical protein